MKIKIAQMNVICGQPQTNFNKMKEIIINSKKENYDMIIFPEMCVSGYLLMDKFYDDSFCKYIDSFNEKILELSDGIAIIFGNLAYNRISDINLGRDGRPTRLNAAFFAYNKKWIEHENTAIPYFYVKHLNPDYSIFDDSRYFLSGLELSNKIFNNLTSFISPYNITINNKTYKIGIEICEDMWSENYAINPTEIYDKLRCDIIINISASPFTISKNKQREAIIREHLKNSKNINYYIYNNCCGMQNTGKNIVVFDGKGSVYNNRGKIIENNNNFSESYITFNTDYQYNNLKKKEENSNLLDALTCAIKEFDKQMFNSKIPWIIGLSGGLDSSITAALLVKALGNNRVIGYNLASNYNSLTTKNNARQLANVLEINLKEGSIELLNSATLETLQTFGYDLENKTLVKENIQARIRGHLLCSFAGIEGGVICNNANKVETALGYCTLYGDSIGAIAPIADLTKTELFTLAKEINTFFNKEVIPNSLLPEITNNSISNWDCPPSAELKENQIDPMKWFYHDKLIKYFTENKNSSVEKILSSYLNGDIYNSELGDWIKYYKLDNPSAFIDDLEWFVNTLNKAKFKRYQMPPIVKVSENAFGMDNRESQMNLEKSDEYVVLKRKILEKNKK